MSGRERVVIIGSDRVCNALRQAFKEHAVEAFAGVENAARKHLGNSLAAVLVEGDYLLREGGELGAAVEWQGRGAPVLLLVEGQATEALDQVKELRNWPRVSIGEGFWRSAAQTVDRWISAREVAREIAFLRQVLEYASDCIMSLEGDGHIRLANTAVTKTFGYDRQELMGSPLEMLVDLSDQAKPAADMLKSLQTGVSWSGQVTAVRKDGERFPAQVALTFIPDETHAAVLVARDVTDHEELVTRLKRLSIMDDLTQCYNVRYFWARFRFEFLRSARYDEQLSCLIVDLDHFKKVNDLHGHRAGDEVLRAAARAMDTATRKIDILARYGGDEFAIILPGTGLKGALVCANHIRDAVAEAVVAAGQETIGVSVSVGAATMNEETADEEALLAKADEALMEAKRSGRNKTCAWQGGQVSSTPSPERAPLGSGA